MIKKIIMMMSAAVAMVCVQAATTYTEMVDGIEWTYTVTDSEASVGGGSDTSPAVPKTTSGAITIPSTLGGYPVTSIGGCAFHSCRLLTSVTIPDSVTSIEDYAFFGCRSFTSVTIPDSVTSIEYYAFAWCDFTSVTIGNSVTSIGSHAFFGCSLLTSVTIPDSVTSIGERAFSACKSLANVTIGNGVMSIGDDAFTACESLTSITIGDSVTSIGDYAFNNCNRLMSITIPDSVASIGDYVFNGCYSLVSVTIGNGVTSIGGYLFYGCDSLQDIFVDSDNNNYKSIDGLLLSKDGKVLIECPNAKICVAIPENVTNIGSSAFSNCRSLTSVTIPNSVTSIGDWAFYDCSSLSNIVFNGNAPESLGNAVFRYVHSDCTAYVKKNSAGWGVDIPGKWQGINIAYLEEDESTSITYSYDQIANGEIVLTGIIGEVPENWVCPSMYEGNKVVGLGDHFLAESEEIRSVVLADTIREVGESAFKKCPNLSSVILNEGLEIIRGYAFRKCFSLESVILPSSISIIEERAFCRSGENYRWDEGDGIGIQRIEIRGGENDAFSCEDGVLYDKINKKVIMARANIERVVLPEDCTRIGDCAFLSCYNLNEVVWNTALSKIGDEAFAGTYLTTGDLSKTSLTLAQEQAFAGCSLKEVVFPSTLRTVGSHLFGLCDSLESVRFLGNAPEIDNSAEETEEGFPRGDIYVTISSGSVEDVYDIHLPNVTTFVEKGTSGWGEVPGTWQGCPINYWSMSTDPIPDLGASATASEVAAALDGSADANLAENIKTAVEYAAYRTWALKLGGVTPREVKDSPNAWLSYALDTDALIAVAPKEGDVVIDTFKSAATDGAFEFTVKIDGIEVGDNALEANIRKVFDIEGIEKLESGSIGFSSDNVEVNVAASVNGDIKFTVTPKSENGKKPNSFFFRVKMK